MARGRRGRSLSDDSDAEASAAARRSGRKREVAALLADQRNHASVEELQALRSYVKNVFEHGDDDNISSGAGRSRARRVTNKLPDMFGVVRGEPNRGHGRGGAAGGPKVGAAGPTGASSSNEEDELVPVDADVMSVLNNSFHAVRWRLLRSAHPAAPSSAVPQWVRSDSNAGGDATLMIRKALFTTFDGDEVICDDARRAVATRAVFKQRQALEDSVGTQEHHRGACEQRGLLDHKKDAVLLRDAKELTEVVAYLRRAMSHGMAADLRAVSESVIESIALCGTSLVADLLQVFCDTRTVIVACDRWFAHIEAERRESLTAADAPAAPAAKDAQLEQICKRMQSHACSPVKEMLLTLLYATIGSRIEALERRLFESSATSAELHTLFRRLVRVHPFSPYRLLPEETTTDGSVSNPDSGSAATSAALRVSGGGVPSHHMTAAAAAFAALFQTFLAERQRTERLSASVAAEASVNIPLQRQTAKYDVIRKAMEALSARYDTVDDEERKLGEDLGVQMEVSSRLADLIHCGAIMDDKIVSQPTSYIMESVLWTLPSSLATVQHREIEEALEKFLWGHPYALMSDDLVTTEYVHAIRKQLLVNLALRRAVTRKMTILGILRKLTESDLKGAVEATSEDGVALPPA